MKKLMHPFGITMFTALIVLPSMAFASTPFLKRSAIVSGPTISLADLVDGENLPTDGLFQAPAPGQSGLIRASRIVEAAQKAGIKTLLGDATSSVMVTRHGRKLDIAAIDTAIKQAITAKGEIDQPEYTLTSGTALPDIYVEDAAQGTPVVSDLKIDRNSLSFTAILTVRDSSTLLKEPFRLEGKIADIVTIAVTTREIAKNDVFTAGDFRIEKRDRKAVTGLNLPKPSLLLGQAAKIELAAGLVITDELVTRPMLVEKGMAVSVTYSAGGLRLTLRGKANEAGGMGDMISILNPQSKKVIFATVIAPGAVAISASPAPVAARQSTHSVQ
jgi:flagella basal body P-ring formation protein FlgA